MKLRYAQMRVLVGAMLALSYAFQPSALAAPAVSPASSTSVRWQLETVDSSANVGQYASVAIQPGTGIPYISYYDATNYSLRVAFYKANGGNCGTDNHWYCYVREPGSQDPRYGRYSSIALSQAGTPAIAYDEEYGNGSATYNLYDGPYPGSSTIWTLQPVDYSFPGPLNGRFNSLKLDGSGTPRIASQSVDGYVLRYASYVGSGGNCSTTDTKWQCDTVDSDIGAVSLDLNFLGLPSIAYVGGLDELKQLSFATYLGSGGNCGQGSQLNKWRCDGIDTSADALSLYVRKCLVFPCYDHSHIAYGVSGSLKHAENVGTGGNCGPADTSWRCEVIDDMGVTNFGSLTVGLAVFKDVPIIAYQDTNDQRNAILKVARFVGYGGNCGLNLGLLGHTWRCEVVDDGHRTDPGGDQFHDVATNVSIALNSAGLATIAYDDATAGHLLVARQQFQSYLPMAER